MANLTTLNDINKVGNYNGIKNNHQTFKLYYYKVTFGGYDNYAFNSNGTTMVYVEQPKINNPYYDQKLKDLNFCLNSKCDDLSNSQIKELEKFHQEANTGKFIEIPGVLECISIDSYMSNVVENRNSLVSSKLRFLNKHFHTIFTNQQIFNFESDDFYIFTFEPLEPTKFNQGNQEVYICEKNIPNKILQNNPDLDDDLKALESVIREEEKSLGENSYTLIPVDQVNNLENSNWKMTFGNRPTKIQYIQVNHDRTYAPINVRVFGDGYINDNQLYFNEETDVHMYPGFSLVAKLTPYSLNNGLSCYSVTWDWNKTLPPQVIADFVKEDGGWKVNTIKKYIVTSDQDWQKALYQILITQIKLTRAYATSFGEYQITGENNQLIYDPKASIGRLRTIGQLTNLEPNSVISSLITEWRITYPLNIYTNEYKLFNAFTLALNNFIISQKNISQGGNNLNLMYTHLAMNLNTPIVKDTESGEPCLGLGTDCNPATESYKLNKILDISLIPNGNSMIYPLKKENNIVDFIGNYNYYVNTWLQDIDGLVPFAQIPEQLTNSDLLSSNLSDLPDKTEDISKFWITLRHYEKMNSYRFYSFNSKPTSTTTIPEDLNGSYEYLWKVNSFKALRAINATCLNREVFPNVFFPDRKPPITINDIAARIIQNLPSGTKLKFNSDGTPAITNFVLTPTRGIRVLTYWWVTTIFFKECDFEEYDTWTASFQYSIEKRLDENSLLLGNLQQNINRQGWTNLTREALESSKNEFSFKAKLVDRNAQLSADENYYFTPKEVRLNGFWGQNFKIAFSSNEKINEENVWESEYIEFPSRFDESKILTTIFV